MKTEQIKIGINKDLDSFKITAEEGKILARKSDKQVFGKEIVLGYTWYLNGEKLDEPHWEVPSDYEEIDEPSEETVNS